MELKPRFFIYDRKEMWIGLTIGLSVLAFCFTLGLHFGKKLYPKTAGALTSQGGHNTHDSSSHEAGVADGHAKNSTDPHAQGGHGGGHDSSRKPAAAHGAADKGHVDPQGEGTKLAKTAEDALPNRQELDQQVQGIPAALEETVSEILHGEVVKTGVKLAPARQIRLPAQVKADGFAALKASHGGEDEKSEVVVKPKAPHTGAAAEHKAAWTLSLGVFSDKKEAQNLVDSLDLFGLKAEMLPAKKGQHQVWLGRYDNEDQAQKAGQSYVRQHLFDRFEVIAAPSE